MCIRDRYKGITMNTTPVTMLAAILAGTQMLGFTRVVCADSFQNLDFEQAIVQTAPLGYVPYEADPPISSAAALPYWTVHIHHTNTTCTAIWGQPKALDVT